MRAPESVEAAWTRLLEVRGGVRPDLPEGDRGTEAGQFLDLLSPVAATPGTALTLAQLGQSLDGRIATESGHSHYVTGAENLDHLHRLRALVDAVVVGAGTVASDDPQLTVRRVSGENPVRVVLDPRRRLACDYKVFADAAAPTLLLVGNDGGSAHNLAEVVTLPVRDGGFAPAEVLAALHGRGLTRVLVEGGGVTISRFLAAGLLDRLHVAVAPLLVGSGRPGLTLPPIQELTQALRPHVRVFSMGADTLFDCDLRGG